MREMPNEDEIAKMGGEEQTFFAGTLIINRMMKDILSNTMDRVAKGGVRFNLAKYLDEQVKERAGHRHFIEEARKSMLESADKSSGIVICIIVFI